MYALVKGLIDNVLMGPQLAPFTTFGIVILIGLTALAVLAGGSSEDMEEAD